MRSFLPIVVEILGPSLLMLMSPDGQNRIRAGALTLRYEKLIRERLSLADHCIAQVIDAVLGDAFLDDHGYLVRDLSVVLGCRCHDGVKVISDV